LKNTQKEKKLLERLFVGKKMAFVRATVYNREREEEEEERERS
jgi:hypothetical protein